MKSIATIIAIIIPILAFAQSPANDGYVCHRQGFADSLSVGGCGEFIYTTPGLDVDGIPIEIHYQRTPDSVLVWWHGHRFYQATTDSLTLWESMQAYNFALEQIFPK